MPPIVRRTVLLKICGGSFGLSDPVAELQRLRGVVPPQVTLFILPLLPAALSVRERLMPLREGHQFLRFVYCTVRVTWVEWFRLPEAPVTVMV